MSPCEPAMNIVPLGCASGGNNGSSPGDVFVEGCCSPSIATTTLCAADDCTPISLVVRSGCADCSATPDDPQVVGWIGGSGTYTPGTPPTGLVSCESCADTSPDEPCEPVPMCSRLVGMSGPDQWVMPEGTESLSVSIVCGPITITDCQGEATVINEGCGSVQWAAQGTECAPGVLCTPFTVDVPDGSAVYITYLIPCEEI